MLLFIPCWSDLTTLLLDNDTEWMKCLCVEQHSTLTFGKLKRLCSFCCSWVRFASRFLCIPNVGIYFSVSLSFGLSVSVFAYLFNTPHWHTHTVSSFAFWFSRRAQTLHMQRNFIVEIEWKMNKKRMLSTHTHRVASCVCVCVRVCVAFVHVYEFVQCCCLCADWN